MRATVTYLLALACGLAVCFAAQGVQLRRSAGRSVKSESNFFSTLARLQNGMQRSPQMLLLGSSMTGRLPDRSRGFDGVANMGCDGGSAVEILHAIDRGEIPGAPQIIVEGNTLEHGFDLILEARKQHSSDASPVAAAVKTWTFREGANHPSFSAAGRPAALIYSPLMERKLGAVASSDVEPLHSSTHPGPLGTEMKVKDEEEPLIDDLAQVATRLQARGSRLTVVILPGAPVSDGARAVAVEFARRAGLPFWDLGGTIAKDAVTLTDGTHMAPASAASAMKAILQEVKP